MKKRTYFFTFLLIVLLLWKSVFSCTSFVLYAKKMLLFCSNYDNRIWPGLIYVNKKNISKKGWEPSTTGKIAAWISKYGSVTFNVAGYQLAWAGMNEEGLVLSTMALQETVNPEPDERPPLVSSLWMQYIFDTCATLDDVIASDRLIRIKDTVDHYLVCDASGKVAVIEFLDGKMVCYRGKDLPLKVLANRNYEECVSEWRRGISEDLDYYRSELRMNHVNKRLLDFDPRGLASSVDFSFDVLDDVSSSNTRWSIVFDVGNRIIHFKSFQNQETRSIYYKKLNFNCITPALMFDVHTSHKGDITDELEVIDPERSLSHLLRFLKDYGSEFSEEQVKMLFYVFMDSHCISEKKD